MEIRLYVELKSLLQSVRWRDKIGGRECDVLLPDAQVAIEVDGKRWHAGQSKKDKAKTTLFESHGLHVIRLREKPLRRLQPHDIVYDGRAEHLGVIVRLIGKLLTRGHFTAMQRQRLSEYGAAHKYQAEAEFRKILAQLPKPPHGDSLLDKVPASRDYWNFEANRPLLPDMFTAGSNKRVYWRCEEAHHPPTEKSIKQWVRNHREGSRRYCPYCRGQKVASEDSLADKHPALAKEYGRRNAIPANAVWPKWTRKKVWWLCSNCGHEWKATPHSRAQRSRWTGCPKCGHRTEA